MVYDNSISRQPKYYIIATYPSNDDLLRHASFLNFENRVNIGFDSVEYFVSRYPHLHGLTVPREIELLQEEFVSYQLLNDSDIPTARARARARFRASQGW